MTKHHTKLAQKRIQQRDTHGRGLWYLIAASVGAVVVMSLFGFIDWTPRQANVPTQTEPVPTESLQKAAQNGSLELHPY